MLVRAFVGHGVDVCDQLLRSALLATFLRMWGGAIPASAYLHGIGVAFKQPANILYNPCIIQSGINMPIVCLERSHQEQANSAVEKQSANAVVRTVAG